MSQYDPGRGSPLYDKACSLLDAYPLVSCCGLALEIRSQSNEPHRPKYPVSGGKSLGPCGCVLFVPPPWHSLSPFGVNQWHLHFAGIPCSGDRDCVYVRDCFLGGPQTGVSQAMPTQSNVSEKTALPETPAMARPIRAT